MQLADSKAAFLTKYPAHLPKRHRCPCRLEALTPQQPARVRHASEAPTLHALGQGLQIRFRRAGGRPAPPEAVSSFIAWNLKAEEPKKRHAGARDLAANEGA